MAATNGHYNGQTLGPPLIATELFTDLIFETDFMDTRSLKETEYILHPTHTNQ